MLVGGTTGGNPLTRLIRFFSRPEPVNDAAGLREWVATRSAFVSQRCTMEYCRHKAHAGWDLLIKEEAFLERLEVCRWDGYAAVAADLSVAVEGMLRPHLPGREVLLSDWLIENYAQVLFQHAPPQHMPEGWQPLIDDFRKRITRTQLANPAPVHEIAKTSGDLIYDRIPLHARFRIDDRPVVRNNVRFNVCSVIDGFLERADLPAIAQSIEADRIAADREE